jgi:hypothetical protein
LAAAAAGAGLVIWTEARFGRFDPEFVGGTWLLPFLVGLMAVAFASAALVSGMARLVAAGVAGLCLAWLTIAGWSNVAGAGRSIGEVSWGLVGAFAVVGAFVAMALLTLATKRRWT